MERIDVMDERQQPAAFTPLPARCRVLLVDDCPDTTRLLRAYLADPGIELTAVNNGRDGIEAFKCAALPFNLVFMDMEMPGTDGCAATMEMRRWEIENRLPRTPIAAFTALSDTATATRMVEAGCTIHLTKPILRQRLLQIVGQYDGPRLPAPELLPDLIATCRSELESLVDSVKAWDPQSIVRTGRRLRSLGTTFGLSAICEIGACLEEGPNLGVALYGVEKLRCCIGVLEHSLAQGGAEFAVPSSGESIETQVIRDLLPEYIASMLEKTRQMVLASQHGDYGQVKTIANQLKGTGNAFGLPTVSEAGKAIGAASEKADDLAVARNLSNLSGFLGAFTLRAPEKSSPAAVR